MTSAMNNGGRSGHGCAAVVDEDNVKRSIIVVGGDTYPGDVSRSVEVYHLETGGENKWKNFSDENWILSDKWLDLQSLPSGLSSPGVISYGEDILVLGGYDSGIEESFDDGISKNIFRWNKQKWTKSNATLNYARAVFSISNI